MAKKKETVKIIPNEKNYDGIIIFDTPVKIKDEENKLINIYGVLFNKDRKHNDALWQWEITRYYCYLMACERVQEHNGKLAPEMFILNNGKSIPLTTECKNLIYRLLKDQLLGYRIKEFIEPFADIKEGETDSDLVISESFVERYGYEILSFDTIMNEMKNEKID